MASIFGTLISREDTSSYKFGEIISITGNRIGVRTTTGLEVKITEDSTGYNVGDQIVLGVHDSNLNNLFILKKIDKTYPSSINHVIDLDID